MLMTRSILLLALLGHLLPVHAAPVKRVLWIMADDFRPEMGCYGSEAKTPHLDALAQRSLRFDRAYCQQAVCNPSRSSLLTGRRPDSLKVWSNSLHFRSANPEVETLPGWLKKQGFQSLCVGKIFHNWHTEIKGDPESWSRPEFLHYANHGHDHALGDSSSPSATMVNQGRRYGEMELCEARDVADEAYYDGRVAAEAVRQIRQLPRDKPWFLAVGFWKPHAPFNAPKKYWDLYNGMGLPKDEATAPKGAPPEALHASTEILGPPQKQRRPSAEEALEMRRGYCANVSYLDAQVGKVLQALRDQGLERDTLIVFLSDHGYHLGEHGLWGKTSNFELDARVPLLIADPDSAGAGKTSRSLVELVDLFPTVLDWLGVGAPGGLDGKSLMPILKDPRAEVKAVALTQHPRPAYFDREPSGSPKLMGYSLRTRKFRLTHWRSASDGRVMAREFYLTDQNDPEERFNQIDNPAHLPMIEQAEGLLLQHFGLGVVEKR